MHKMDFEHHSTELLLSVIRTKGILKARNLKCFKNCISMVTRKHICVDFYIQAVRLFEYRTAFLKSENVSKPEVHDLNFLFKIKANLRNV